jgi:hypothetical protein
LESSRYAHLSLLSWSVEKQLLMAVLSKGSTGKSRVIQAIF